MENNGGYVIAKDKKRFEWMDVRYPVAFKPGDIVKHCGEHRYGVIVPSEDGGKDALDIMEICLNGDLFCTFFHPFFVEKVEELIDCPHMKILKCISDLYSGKITYKDFIFEFRWNKAKVAKYEEE